MLFAGSVGLVFLFFSSFYKCARITIRKMGSSQLLAKSGTILFDFPVPPTDVTDERGVNKVEGIVLGVLCPDFGKFIKK